MHPTLEKIIKAPASCSCSIYIVNLLEPSIHTRLFCAYRLSSLALLEIQKKKKSGSSGDRLLREALVPLVWTLATFKAHVRLLSFFEDIHRDSF